MTYYACHVTRERGYASIAFLSPPRPRLKGDTPGCVNYQEKKDGRCRITGKLCDAKTEGA